MLVLCWCWDASRKKWAVTGKKIKLRESAAYPGDLGVSLGRQYCMFLERYTGRHVAGMWSWDVSFTAGVLNISSPVLLPGATRLSLPSNVMLMSADDAWLDAHLPTVLNFLLGK